MKILTNEEVRAIENRIIASGTSADTLMERAAEGIVAALAREFPAARDVLCLIGKGNNGGDGLAVARRLAEAGWRVAVGLAFEPAAATPLCAAKLTWLRTAFPAVPVFSLTEPSRQPIPWPGAQGLVIDALLGIGARGGLSPVLGEIVSLVNRERNGRFFRVAAIDGPTGAHRLAEKEEALIADVTLTLGFGKEPLFAEAAANAVGRIIAVPIFEGQEEEERAASDRAEALTPPLLLPLVPRRAARSHKGTYGRILIVGGSRGMTGAPVLSSLGALRSGAGLLHIATRKEALATVSLRAPLEAMVVAAGDGADFTGLLGRMSVLVVGPGLGTDYDASELLRRILAETTVPLVLDADALTLAAQDRTLLDACRGRAILTPHPGEMERLLGRPCAEAEREAVAVGFAEEHGVVLVLKGVRTVVAAPGAPARLNTTGNPGLAAGGSGDLLAGMIAAQAGRGLALREAASLAVWLHGRAADLAVRSRGAEEGLGAVEVAEWIAPALADLRGA
ncbi:NAD(P)H-hydrate epimerase [Verrucomicrobium sp. GAS474]|uniref:NAD(P)H-hydrate dehydratase n=1 Tax=Verrucomicrobium sp. GAS474 TaxID=1882831 RepID=UPI000879E9A3|nr:NAD(P)H-hydrate dehydratase [Verrucomicrobium sp. GAS474]SDU17653.1 NAD(P)H-hydrate epimerase [Verrucomicrobium sp. GAS474]